MRVAGVVSCWRVAPRLPGMVERRACVGAVDMAALELRLTYPFLRLFTKCYDRLSARIFKKS